jgi:hypothetical protein
MIFILLVRSKFISFSQSMLWRVVTSEKLSLGKQTVFEQDDRLQEEQRRNEKTTFRDYVVYGV